MRMIFLQRLGLDYEKKPSLLKVRLQFCWHHIYTNGGDALLFCDDCYIDSDDLLKEQIQICQCQTSGRTSDGLSRSFVVDIHECYVGSRNSVSKSGRSLLVKGWIPPRHKSATASSPANWKRNSNAGSDDTPPLKHEAGNINTVTPKKRKKMSRRNVNTSWLDKIGSNSKLDYKTISDVDWKLLVKIDKKDFDQLVGYIRVNRVKLRILKEHEDIFKNMDFDATEAKLEEFIDKYIETLSKETRNL